MSVAVQRIFLVQISALNPIYSSLNVIFQHVLTLSLICAGCWNGLSGYCVNP